MSVEDIVRDLTDNEKCLELAHNNQFKELCEELDELGVSPEDIGVAVGKLAELHVEHRRQTSLSNRVISGLNKVAEFHRTSIDKRNTILEQAVRKITADYKSIGLARKNKVKALCSRLKYIGVGCRCLLDHLVDAYPKSEENVEGMVYLSAIYTEATLGYVFGKEEVECYAKMIENLIVGLQEKGITTIDPKYACKTTVAKLSYDNLSYDVLDI